MKQVVNAWSVEMIPSGVASSKNVTDPFASTNGLGVAVKVTLTPWGALAADELAVMVAD